MNKIGIWLKQIRAPFLLLSVLLVLIGISKSYSDGYSDTVNSVIVLIGVVFAHISVNLFNELSDFKTGIDDNTGKTPFSGGSGMLQEGKTDVKRVKFVAYLSLIIAGIIGIYFCITISYYIFLLIVIGGVSVRFYTSHLSRYLLGEIFTGLSLGSLVIIGTYLVLTSTITLSVIYISLPVGLLTFLLLLLNEFPDAEADKTGGRKHIVISFGKKRAFNIYVFVAILVYIFIFLYPIIFNTNFFIYLSLSTAILLIKIIKSAKPDLNDIKRLTPALGMNITLVLLTDFLISVGFLIK